MSWLCVEEILCIWRGVRLSPVRPVFAGCLYFYVEIGDDPFEGSYDKE